MAFPFSTSQTILGFIVLLESNPNIHECSIIAHGAKCTPRCVRLTVADEAAVKESIACIGEKATLLEPTHALVDLRANNANTKAKEDEQAVLELRSLNSQIEELEKSAQKAALDTTLDSRIAALDVRAAELIRQRTERRLGPLERESVDAVATARELLLDDETPTNDD